MLDQVDSTNLLYLISMYITHASIRSVENIKYGKYSSLIFSFIAIQFQHRGLVLWILILTLAILSGV